MLIELKTLVHLPVFTESGNKLGVVQGLELDLQNHSVRSYTVGSFFNKDSYRIRPTQIKEITLERILVEDTLLKEKQKEEIREGENKVSKPVLGGVMPAADKEN